MKDESKYQEYQRLAEERWEARCHHCGACCGAAEGDPCEHLGRLKTGRYFCKIYDKRFGTHRTVSGRMFRCVPIREILHQSWPGDRDCGYKN